MLSALSISRAMVEVKEDIKKNPKTRFATPHIRLIRAQVEYNSLAYVLQILSQDTKFSKLSIIINQFGSIFVVGAGISAKPGIPLADELKPILNFFKVKDYSELVKDKSSCHRFKIAFKKLSDDKNVGLSHELIAKHFGKKIRYITVLIGTT